MNEGVKSKSSSRLPLLLGIIGIGFLGYGIFDWVTGPSQNVVSRIAYEPFPEFLEGGTYQISVKFENKTNSRIRVVGMEGC